MTDIDALIAEADRQLDCDGYIRCREGERLIAALQAERALSDRLATELEKLNHAHPSKAALDVLWDYDKSREEPHDKG